MKTKFLFGSFLIAGAALLFSCNNVAEFPELPEPDKNAVVEPQALLRGRYCVYSDPRPQCFEGDFTACPGGGDLKNTCPYVSSSSQSSSSGLQTRSSSSGGGLPTRSSSGGGGLSAQSSSVQSSSSTPNCLGFSDGTMRAHQGTSKAQFCDSRDNKRYVYVPIGAQTWMAENLNYWKAEAITPKTTGSTCYASNTANCNKYGVLYNWNEAKTACPVGWRLPSDADWQQLVAFVESIDKDGSPNLRAKSGWKDFNGLNKDTYGFSALPGGYNKPNGTSYIGEKESEGAYWWSSTEDKTNPLYDQAKVWVIQYGSITLPYEWYSEEKDWMFSVRCLRIN